MHRWSASELLASVCAPADDPRPVPAVCLIAPHPDDEVVGAGARLPRLARARGGFTVVAVTDGSPRDLGDANANGFTTRERYAHCRRRERVAALTCVGIDAVTRVVELGVVDQEASDDLAWLARRMAQVLAERDPDAVIAPPYEGGHPDHDAAAFAVQWACRLLKSAGLRAPARLEATSYHNGPTGITPGVFLPTEGAEEIVCLLSDADRTLKRRLFDCYPTQQGTLRYFPADAPERLRIAPEYDFSRPPHGGTLFYENFGWRVTGAVWRARAREAEETLCAA